MHLSLRLRDISLAAGRHGVLRSDLDLFRGPGTAGARRQWPRPTASRATARFWSVSVVDGWPIAHHVFEGNRRDANTVPHVLHDLEQRFG